MGFDLYGVNPRITPGSVEPTRPESFNDSPKEEWNAYYDALDQYHSENPGVYFRSNVWYWRPIVEFLAEHIEILEEEDLNGLSYNDGYLIDESLADYMGIVIDRANLAGDIDRWIEHKKIRRLLLDKEECTICEGTGVRRDMIARGAGLEPYTKDGIEGYKCNACDGEGKKEPFENNYPYDKKAILDFGKFAKESGGFTVS